MKKNIYLILLLSFVSGTLANNLNRIIIIIPSYNNEKWCIKNLKLLFNQDYSNYKVIFVNDVSTDNTGKLVLDYINKNKLWNNFEYRINKTRQLSLKNIYNSVHRIPYEAESIKKKNGLTTETVYSASGNKMLITYNNERVEVENNDIIIHYDGDDWLSDDCNIFTKINEFYNNGCLATFGNFKDSKTGIIKYPKYKKIDYNIRSKNYWFLYQLRTFRAFLFKNINKNDLVTKNNKFFDVCSDVAYMLPIIEMAGDRVMYIDENFYIRNSENPISDQVKKFNKQNEVRHFIYKKKRYKRIT